MSKTSIKVQYVNQPKSPKGPGSVKTDTGVYYKVWPKAKDGGATLSQFEAGRTYEIEYDTEQYEGQDKYVARRILSSSESSNGDGGHPFIPGNLLKDQSDRSARIERQAALKVAAVLLSAQVQAGKAEPTPDNLFDITDRVISYIEQSGSAKLLAAVEQEVEI